MRKYLTPKQRRAMYEAQDGRCKVCGDKMELGKYIGEHWYPVALGNDQKPDCLLCIPCADRKTNGTKATTYGSDKHAIAKVKRLAAGKKPRKGRPLQGRGFDKTLRRKFDGTVERRT